MNDHSTYLLIDTAMMPSSHKIHSLKAKPSVKWLRPLYGRPDLAVSPVVIDIAEAVRSNRVALMMEAVHGAASALCVSLIDSELSLDNLVAHLQQFTYFVDEAGAEFTLRMADCAVLASLSETLTIEQWACFTSPFRRWLIHDRDGRLFELSTNSRPVQVDLPLVLTEGQISELVSRAEPDRLLANLQIMKPEILVGWAGNEAHRTAAEVLDVWNRSANGDRSTLLIFARAVFDSRARLLKYRDIVECLQGSDQQVIRTEIKRRFEEIVT